MLTLLRNIVATLSSLFIFVIGNGLFSTLLALRLQIDHMSPLVIGSMMATYYLGLMLGSLRLGGFITRVGLIRAFATFSSILAVVYVLHGLYIETWFWLTLRVIGGFATAGIFIVIESWLLILGTERTRGQILSFYMISFFAAQALGQLFLNFASPKKLLLYAIAAMTASLAVIPLAITHIQAPTVAPPSSLTPKKLYFISPTGIVGCVCSGLILGVLYGLMPVYLLKVSQSIKEVTWVMATLIIGGMVLQYPIGKLSDYLDRRLVLIGVSTLIAVVSFILIFTSQITSVLFTMIFLLGGLSFTIYPVSVSHACDVLDLKDIVAGIQGLILTYSLGACLGPIFASFFMEYLTPEGIFIYIILICLGLTAFFVVRKQKYPPIPKEKQENFIAAPYTTTVIAKLDPRSDEG